MEGEEAAATGSVGGCSELSLSYTYTGTPGRNLLQGTRSTPRARVYVFVLLVVLLNSFAFSSALIPADGGTNQ